ncbi:hypothetical protein HDU98_005829, partial [Podochytrium sp. JEL0797]
MEPKVQESTPDASVVIPTAKEVLKIEATGIDPIPEYNRIQNSIIDNFTFWASCNTVIPSFALGT